MKKKEKKENNKEFEAVHEQLVRALADYDNLKKRVEEEREVFSEVATARLITRFLPIFDMFEQVQKHLNDSGLAIAIGELNEKLKDEGVSPIQPKAGEVFDEHTMEAVDSIETDKVKKGEIVELSLKGWRMRDRILRYAKVVVAKKGDEK
jgi:molecular chaperone GrpE